MTITTRTHARAGLLGNPSDGYGGRTISIALSDFEARVSLSEADELVIDPGPGDRHVYGDLSRLLAGIAADGYPAGAAGLLAAAVKRFSDWCGDEGVALPERNFSLNCTTTIPRQVGLAGSSAIITSAMKALMQFYDVQIPIELLPTLILEAETLELGIEAGPQDRVIQVYGGCVYMDFEPALIETRGYGRYEPLDPALLPPLWLAWRRDHRKVSGQALGSLRARFEAGDGFVVGILNEIAALAREGRDILRKHDHGRLAELMDRNFDLRRRIMPIDEGDLRLIERARELGSAAKLTGSGGAILGLSPPSLPLSDLALNLGELGADVIEPRTG
jgi:glucuronokinase